MNLGPNLAIQRLLYEECGQSNFAAVLVLYLYLVISVSVFRFETEVGVA